MWTLRVPFHEGPTLEAGQLRLPLLLLAEDLRVIRIVFYEDDERGEDEGETTSAKEEYDVPKVAENAGGGERSKLMSLGKSKGEREQGRRQPVSCRLVARRTAVSSTVSRPPGSLTCWE